MISDTLYYIAWRVSLPCLELRNNTTNKYQSKLILLHDFNTANVDHFPALGTCYTFSAFGNGRMFSHPWQWLYFSYAWKRLHIFPPLATFAFFPALGNVCLFTHSWQCLHVFMFACLGIQFSYHRAINQSERICCDWPVFITSASLKTLIMHSSPRKKAESI